MRRDCPPARTTPAMVSLFGMAEPERRFGDLDRIGANQPFDDLRVIAIERRGIAFDPDHAVARLGLGRIALNEERFADARPWLEEALALDSSSPGVHEALAQLYFELGDAARSEDHLEQARALRAARL